MVADSDAVTILSSTARKAYTESFPVGGKSFSILAYRRIVPSEKRSESPLTFGNFLGHSLGLRISVEEGTRR